MGLFLDLSGIAHTDQGTVARVLQRYAERRSGSFTSVQAGPDDLNIVSIAEGPQGKVL
jgi:hypothetical protein